MTLPLLPAASVPQCRGCRRPALVGPMVRGFGPKCARRRGLLLPTRPRLPKAGHRAQPGPDLFDAINGDDLTSPSATG